MKIYNYEKATGEFISSSVADKNPLEEESYLIPANATSVEPLSTKKGFAICFNEELNIWKYVEDNRGIAYTTRDEIIVDYLGELKVGVTKEPIPLTEFELDKIKNNKQVKEAKEYLTSTDFYFTVDKYVTLSKEKKLELTTARAEARLLINDLE